jgi:thymidylate synthase (FAD)
MPEMMRKTLSKQATDDLFEELGGESHTVTKPVTFHALHAPVHLTPSDKVPFLREPGVVLLRTMVTDLSLVKGFLDGFAKELEFSDYLDDPAAGISEDALGVKFAGQLCYLSFGPKRSKNKDVGEYLENIKKQGHGSVLEHTYHTFLFYGNSRSETHEKVRHRVGIAFSQVSQRYVDGKVLRFVERPEYQHHERLHDRFMRRIEFDAKEYDEIAAELMELQHAGASFLSGETKRDLRKRVNQAARSCLPNETEAPIVVSLNMRSHRHLSEMRMSDLAEPEIRKAYFKAFLLARKVSPEISEDYEAHQLPDGTYGVNTIYRKV